MTALETGYYEVPRDASARTLTDEFDISHQALSERLRRGHGNLVDDVLAVGAGVADAESGRSSE